MPHLNGIVPTPLDGLQAQLRLYLACSKCSQQENESTYSLKEVEHRCMMEILLAKRKGKRRKLWRKIGRRPSFPNPARYDVCRYYVAGLGCKKHRNRCTFAWSKEEVIVWTFERKHNMERHVLKALVRLAQTGAPVNGLSKPPQPGIAEQILSEFGGRFQEICKPCFYQIPPKISPKSAAQDCKRHWGALLVHVITDGKMKEQYSEIRPCPANINSISYCRYVSGGKLCRHTVLRCNFAHSDVEKAVWEAERKCGLNRAELLSPLADCRPDEQAAEPGIQFYCRVCLVTCQSQESFENHCSSVEHLQLITTDTTTEWVHRAPPYGLKTFALCSRGDICEYGQDCTKAHSPEELEEWIQRAKAAEKNRRSAKQSGLLSYQDRLLAEYHQSHNEVLIISEEVDGVRVTCQQPLRMQAENKNKQFKWVFTVHTQKPLMHVALLKRLPGASFSLGGNGDSWGLVYASGERFQPSRQSPAVVEVHMKCHTFGVYEQWVVFDFGGRPVLVQKLLAKVGQKEHPWHTDPSEKQSGHFVNFERWHSGNRIVVPSVERTSKELELLAKYKPPSISLNFQRGAERKPIARLNYREQMHNFLFREEEAQQSLIAKLNLQVTISLHQMMESVPQGMEFAPPGQLFAHVPSPYSLTQDSSEGYLMYRSVKTAFLALVPPTSNRVFEVEKKAISEHSIWLLLPQRCCVALDLQKDTSVEVEIQFQINQFDFRRWHHAVDQLKDERLVFPDLAACSVPSPLRQTPFPGFNKKQNQAISFITGQTTGIRQVPPLLIYGPFGTGKTYTLAMSALEIIKQPKTRVLICTHTNSAADIYIREYFHDYVTSGHPEAVPLRVKYSGLPVKITDPITQQYCCLSPNKDAFRLPTKEELDRHRILICTSMLTPELGLSPGYFSHILIDEAAQMLECEALVPLSFATLQTCIVLAGDHMQITPKLFCLQGDEQSADHTLLTRLFQNYQKEKHEVALKSRIIFNENYRSTGSIIDFISRHFYVGKGDAIRAMGNIPPHPNIYPLVFCHVAGAPERDSTRTSWYNHLEIMQVVEKVQEMIQTWPYEWGERDPRKICVVSYGMQVVAVRQELRKQRLGEVMVESYENLPGRQFRVIILSAVHTRESLNHLCSSSLDFFNDARGLNTIMTRAQSQVIAVGDAVALCSYGKCCKIWKGFLKECIDKGSVTPATLTLEEVRQAVSSGTSWNQGTPELEGDESDTDSWLSDDADGLNVDDPILQELLDESKVMVVTVTDEGLMNVRSDELALQSSRQEYVSFPVQTMKEYLQMQPNMYKRCEIIKEGFDRASAFTLDETPPLNIQIKGRVNCGMAFTGDQVLVEILQTGSLKASPEGCLRGRVVGVMKKAERDRLFICNVDEFDLRVMIPIDRTVTKIFVPGLRDEPDVIPVRAIDRAGRITLKMRKRITQESKKKYLFAVQVITWREGFYYPLGIVTDILPLASTLEEGLKILDVEYCLTNKYPDSVNNEVVSKRTFSKAKRKDCRTYPTFTVDPPGAQDLDDAISVRDLGDKYEIGVHIADVASVVPKDCDLDVEAKKRGATYYAPGKEPVGMLPSQLSQDLCSLLPQKDRCAISLFVLVDRRTDQMLEVSFEVSTIRSDRQLTYEETEGIIKNYYRAESPSLCFDTLEDCIAVAYHFSQVHRVSRLHEDFCYAQLDEERPLGQRCSHQMVEEFMVMFNSSVGDFLANQVPTRSLTPLRCQAEPNPQQITHLRNKYEAIIPLSIHLSHHLGASAAECLVNTHKRFVILTSLWKHLQSAANACHIPKVLDLITTDDIHPSLAHVNLEFRKLLCRSYFLRSNSSAQSKVGHYSLHIDSYTWATSPIRRYMDIVLQRHILSVLLRKPVVYSEADIELLCHDFNRKNAMAAAYQRKTRSLELAAQLKQQVQQKVCFVVSVEEMAKNFRILFPLNRDTIPEPHLINYRALQLVAQPVFIQERNSEELTWRKRIYSVETSKEYASRPIVIQDKSVTLVPTQDWSKVLAAIRNKDYETVISLLERDHRPVCRAIGRMERSKCSHYVKLSLELNIGDVLNLQLTTDVQRGFPVPFVQLWTVVPGFDICLEHSEKPIECFSKHATQASKDVYRNASEYRKVWLPLSDMEAATCAVAENDSIVLQDLRITWEKKRTKKGQLQGTFSLSKDFLKECAIEVDFSYCYLCIRLSGLEADGMKNEAESLSHGLQQLSLTNGSGEAGSLTIDPTVFTWVAHGCTEEFDEKADQRGQPMVHFYIHFMSMENVPVQVTQDWSKFTVELIPKPLPDVRKEKAIWKLQHANELVRAIALGHKIPEKSMHESVLLKRKSFDLPGSHQKLNPSQNYAIWKALEKPFTLIQGPPGTGKTVVGAHTVYWFHQLNQETETKQVTLDDVNKAKNHILYCGPSNKSVDVVAELLLKMKKFLRPLRVYGDNTEALDFPYPGSSLQISKKSQRDLKSKPEIRSITLHFLIREPSNPYAHEICAFDARVKKKEDITEDEVAEYKKLVRKAKAYELEQHDVILCTCSAACSGILVEKLHVKQVLIDECAMSTEPETLIPLVNYKFVEKVVLLGDHKQLKPVVHNDLCKSLGMETSLFERYKDQAWMLDTQYRMHKAICHFPSAAFYMGQLKTCPSLRRCHSTLCDRGRHCCPIIFGHIEGREKSLMVSTEDGNENSKANLEEVNQVVRIAKQLTLDGTTKPEEIAILTPYNAQVVEIKKNLLLQGLQNITVCTIMKSQGSEWKYVLVSTVRSCPRSEIDRRPTKSWQKKHLGFVIDPNQVNVCITRAQVGLCIIGNRYLLESNPLWRSLLEHYQQRECYTLAPLIEISKASAVSW